MVIKNNKFFITMIVICLGLTFALNFSNIKDKKLVFTCISQLTLSYPDGNNIYANFRGFIYNNNKGLSTYRGTMVNGDMVYIVNVDIPFEIHGGDVKTIIYKKAIKKRNDTTPEGTIWKSMLSEGSTYYLSFSKTPAGEVIVNDRGAITYVCSQ